MTKGKPSLTSPESKELYRATALSKAEIQGVGNVTGMLNYLGKPWAYVGNIAIKSHVNPKYRRHVDMSQDVDVIVFGPYDDNDIERLLSGYENVDIEDARLIDRDKTRFMDIPKNTLRYSPFHTIHVTTNGTTTDLFTYVTGVGPIPVNKEDAESVERFNDLPVMNVGYLLATNLNPKAITQERMTRAAYMLKSKDYTVGDAIVFMRKLKEALEEETISQKDLRRTFNFLRNSPHHNIFRDKHIIGTIKMVL